MWVELTWWWRKIGHSNSILIDILNRSSNIIQFESRSSRPVVNTCAVILFTDHESRDSRLSMSVWFDTSHKLISVGSRVINMAQCNSKRVLLFRTSNASESWYSWWSVVTELSRITTYLYLLHVNSTASEIYFIAKAPVIYHAHNRICKKLEFETRKTYYYRRRKWRTRRINRGSIVCYLVPGIQVFFVMTKYLTKNSWFWIVSWLFWVHLSN